MAVLNEADRIEATARMMRQWRTAELGTIGITAPQLLAMVGDLDTLLSSSEGAIVNAIQEPARTGTTTKVKAYVLREVIAARYIRS